MRLNSGGSGRALPPAGSIKTNFKTNLRLSLYGKLVRLLDSVYLRVGLKPLVIDSWLKEVERLCSVRGSVWTIDYIKGCRLCFTRYLAGTPLTTAPHPGVGIAKDGLPKGVPFLRELLARGVPGIRLANTLLLVSRVLPGSKLPNLETVTAPCGSVRNDALSLELRAAVRSLGWKLDQPVWAGPHMSTKMGPNGQAMMGALSDLHALTEEMLTNISILSHGRVNQWIEILRPFSLLTWNKHFGLDPRGLHSKLSWIRDKEAKARIIAILDYWSQTTLRPIHESVFALLRRIKGDCTFNQASFRTWLPDEGPYWSLDLTAATDRFPLYLQEAVVSEVFSDDTYGKAWASLIADREFWVPWTGGRVKYSCGQPMGAYSSWAVFALAHHLVVRVAAKRAGRGLCFSSYALLGDDIVIADEAVAKEYIAILKSVSVSISDAKSHVSFDTYEFAKRWVHRGEEVTGAPISQVHRFKTKPKWFLLATWMRDVEARWCARGFSLVTRSLLRDLFALWDVPLGYAERLSYKAFRFFNLPVIGEPYTVRLAKANYFVRDSLSGITGCNRYKFNLPVWYGWLAEAKTGVIEEALKKQTQQFNQFVTDLVGLVSLIPEGLDSQSALRALPPVAAVLNNVQDLQQQYDSLRHDYLSGRERRIVENGGAIQVGVDPTRIWSVRMSHQVMYSSASLINKVHGAARRYAVNRSAFLASDEVVE